MLLLGCAGGQLGRHYRAAGDFALPDGSARMVTAGVSLTVRELHGASRAAFFRGAGIDADPFEVLRDGEPVFRTFLMQVENTSAAEAMLNSSFCALHVAERRFPLGYTELYSFLLAALGNDRTVSRLAGLMDETGSTLRAGGRAERLLVFNRVGKARRARLELSGIRVGDREVSMQTIFERESTP